jgi:hypothetical protein
MVALEYQLPRDGHVDLGLYDVAGRHVATLLGERQAAGTHRFEWRPRGRPPGVYFAVLKLDQKALAREMVIAR